MWCGGLGGSGGLDGRGEVDKRQRRECPGGRSGCSGRGGRGGRGGRIGRGGRGRCPFPGFSKKNLRRAPKKKNISPTRKKIRDSGSLPPRILGSPSGKLDPQVTHRAHSHLPVTIHALPELSCPLPVSELRLVAQRARSSRDCPCPDEVQRRHDDGCRGARGPPLAAHPRL